MLSNRVKVTIATFVVLTLLLIYETDFGQNGQTDKPKVFYDTCILKELDPWDPETEKALNYSYNPLENCNKTVELATKLENGKLYFLDKRDNISCWWRCLIPKGDWNMTLGPWNKLTDGNVPECDVIETNCRENRDNDPKGLTPDDKVFKDTVYYEFLHAQVYRKDAPEKTPEVVPLDRPDVHIFVIDSVSNSHFVRALPKTRHYLEEHFGATHFQYLNKVGINSRRNAMAFLLGKTSISIPQSPISRGYSHECFNDSLCCNLLEDPNLFISFQFKEAEYRTLISEDYVYSMFSAGECHGFKITPTDHFMRPFQLRADLDRYQTKILKENIYKGMCRDSYMPQMDYLQDMLDKYPDKPKFTLTWITQLAHDDNNELFRADDYFYAFLRKNRKQFENSYLFVMADHGVRFGLTRLTAAGEREDNNPFLMMSAPASLRADDDLQDTIRANAQQLISHYDLYATFVDIVTPFKPKNSTKADLHGSSLFKPLPQPRSCDRLRVPFEYCICDHPKSTLPDDTPPGRDAGDAAVAAMNKVINTRRDLKFVCSNLTLSDAPVGVESFSAEGDLAIYKITYKVSPGEGQYSGHVSQNLTTKKFTVLSSRLPRLDSYAKTAHCAARSDFGSYCYCKEQTTSTTSFADLLGNTTVASVTTKPTAVPITIALKVATIVLIITAIIIAIIYIIMRIGKREIAYTRLDDVKK